MNSMKKGKDITSTIIVVVFMGLMICSIFAIKADASPLTIGGVTFELGETAFADVVHIVEGYVGGHNCDAGGAGGKIENVLGADTSTCIGDHCQSDHSGLIFDVLFTDNVIINGEGNDLAIFELAYYDGFGVAIFDSATGSFTDYQRFVPQETIDHPVGVVLIDLSNFGFEAGAIVDKIRINTYMLTPGDPVADPGEIAAIGAINSVVPEILSVTITTPKNDEVIKQGCPVIAMGKIKDSVGATAVEIYVDGIKKPGTAKYIEKTGTFEYDAWDTSGTARGFHTIEVRATDSVGNSGSAETECYIFKMMKPVNPEDIEEITQYYSAEHPAIDIAAAEGTPVLAAENGKVVYVGKYDDRSGYKVKIYHGKVTIDKHRFANIYTFYCHLKKDSFTVNKGEVVLRGEQIGEVGHTGHVIGDPGNHLHFEVWENGPGKRVDPMDWI
jgi:hypothetical protein